jgi:hypothetical protein
MFFSLDCSYPPTGTPSGVEWLQKINKLFTVAFGRASGLFTVIAITAI